jgi:hypothetical protein
MILRLSLRNGTSSRINNAPKRLLAQSRVFSSIDDPAFRQHSTAVASNNTSTDYRSWQASQNIDIQRVTQTAIIHELTQQQTRSIEKVVPWFLNTMPAPYFRQVPESFRVSGKQELNILCSKTNNPLFLFLFFKA